MPGNNLEEIFTSVFNFCSNHFELILYTNFAFVIFVGVLLLTLKFSEKAFRRQLLLISRNVILNGIGAIQICMVVLTGYLYWANYERKAPVLAPELEILPTTHWAASRRAVFFITRNELRSIKINGEDEQLVFRAEEPVTEYHFSPDGKFLLIGTSKNLFLWDRQTQQSTLIDSIAVPENLSQEQIGSSASLRGVIGGIRWAPDSRKFCYEISRWSAYAMQEKLYIYEIGTGGKKSVQSPTRRLTSLYWDKAARNLYYLYHEAMDTSKTASAFAVKVFRIGMDDLEPQFVAQIPFETSTVPLEHLKLRNIDLFVEGDKLSFGTSPSQEILESERGAVVGIDQDDLLYYIHSRWFRKRLFTIPRLPAVSEIPRYQYKGGELVVSQMRWLPGGRYVIMRHRFWGILILDPLSGRIGHLIEAQGHTFGWYEDVRPKP